MIKQLKTNKMKNLNYKTMKRLFFVFTITLMIVSCGTNSSKEDPYVVKFTERLIKQYPNYSSNKLAKEAVQDSIVKHAQSFIGKEAKDLEGIEFSFYKLIKGENGYCAVFKGSGLSMIDAPKGSSKKYVIASSNIIAFGNVDDVIATKLDSNKEYFISGILHNWDGDNNLGIYSSMTSNDLDFGTYILEDMSITEIQ